MWDTIDSYSKLDGCDDCGAQAWEPRLHADGAPYLRCRQCGRMRAMPRRLQRDVALMNLPRDAS